MNKRIKVSIQKVRTKEAMTCNNCGMVSKEKWHLRKVFKVTILSINYSIILCYHCNAALA